MDNPLKDSDLKNINRALFNLNELLSELERADKAGIDISEHRLRRDDLEAKLMGLKNAYFPGR